MRGRKSTSPGFVSVVLSDSGEVGDDPAPAARTENASEFTIEVETPDGVRLRVTNEFSAAALVRLLSSLRASC